MSVSQLSLRTPHQACSGRGWGDQGKGQAGHPQRLSGWGVWPKSLKDRKASQKMENGAGCCRTPGAEGQRPNLVCLFNKYWWAAYWLGTILGTDRKGPSVVGLTFSETLGTDLQLHVWYVSGGAPKKSEGRRLGSSVGGAVVLGVWEASSRWLLS